MTPMINTDDLLDAQGVADVLGLRHPNSVHTYLRRYPDMPRPILDLGPGRPRLWLRPEVERWRLGRRTVPATAVRSVPTTAVRTVRPPIPAVPTPALPAVPAGVPTTAVNIYAVRDRKHA